LSNVIAACLCRRSPSLAFSQAEGGEDKTKRPEIRHQWTKIVKKSFGIAALAVAVVLGSYSHLRVDGWFNSQHANHQYEYLTLKVPAPPQLLFNFVTGQLDNSAHSRHILFDRTPLAQVPVPALGVQEEANEEPVPEGRDGGLWVTDAEGAGRRSASPRQQAVQGQQRRPHHCAACRVARRPGDAQGDPPG